MILFLISHSSGCEITEFIMDQNKMWFPREQAPTCTASGLEARWGVFLRLPPGELCCIYARLWRVCNRVRGLVRWFPCTWTRSALRDKWNEVNHLGDCSQVIDFMGHQITLGLAEHMPFSPGQRLSFSQINGSNYSAPPAAINSEPIILFSRSWNEEAQYHWCNHIEVNWIFMMI